MTLSAMQRCAGGRNNADICVGVLSLLYVPAEARNGGSRVATSIQESPPEWPGGVLLRKKKASLSVVGGR